MAAQVVEVLLRKNRPQILCDTCGLQLATGDYVIIEVEGIKDCGQIVHGPIEMEDDLLPDAMPPVLYKASQADVENMQRFREEEQRALSLVRLKIRAHELPMKLIACEYAYDGGKLKVYYTADKRIDFRDLVRDLAHEFHTRIEMKQIGVRDGAGMIGGFGDCGRELCCSTWLKEFRPISVRMAKEQNLALNPNKITGVCSRLKCCLCYEIDFYREARKRYPKVGSRVESVSLGRGIVRDCNPLRGTVLLSVDEKLLEVPLEDLRPGYLDTQQRGGRKPPAQTPERQESDSGEESDTLSEETFDILDEEE